MILKSFSILIAFATFVGAQNSDRSSVCWRPRALASCKSWIVFESAAETRIASSRASRYDSQGRPYALEEPLRVSLTSGAMINVSPAKAIGLTAATTSADRPLRFETRLRHWDGSLGMDFSAGIRAGLNPNPWHRRPGDTWLGGYTGSVGMTRRYVGVDFRMDMVRLRTGGYAREGFVTFRTGSWAAVATLPVVFLAALAASMD